MENYCLKNSENEQNTSLIKKKQVEVFLCGFIRFHILSLF